MSCHCDDGHSQLNVKSTTSRRSVVLLNRERIAMRDLEPNLSQTLQLVSDHSVLMIFICKQLKKHAAFSAVQRSHETNILLA